MTFTVKTRGPFGPQDRHFNSVRSAYKCASRLKRQGFPVLLQVDNTCTGLPSGRTGRSSKRTVVRQGF